MSPPESLANGWKLLPKFDIEGESTHTGRSGHTDSLSLPCPVCRKSHGARLVRSLVVSPITPPRETIPKEPRIDSRYYPPAVPVLSRQSKGPINLSARWSLSVV
ncbi:MAG: hypothetical protein L3J95_00205 [Thermoplasmata archaeon]|nr:hypothetical protein [Thermoplasmata archaeon]MCI4358843.1 hypothetical protein [Thermoplasmata archaeon]